VSPAVVRWNGRSLKATCLLSLCIALGSNGLLVRWSGYSLVFKIPVEPPSFP